MKKNCFVSLEKGEKILYIVAISGGPDSTFLLYKMHSLGYKIVAAHLNYRKRSDSFYDEKLVIQHCRKLSIRLFATKAKNYEKGNFQAIARDLRYNFFWQIAERLSKKGFRVGGVVVAHNFEDSLETYELQKERMSLVSYWGLPFRSQFGRWLVFRPIISFRKETIVKFLMQRKIKYSFDSTNNEEIYRRNIIRKRIYALSNEEKDLLSRQIERENVFLLQRLKKVNRLFEILFADDSLNLESKEWLLSSTEVKQRIVYILISSFLGDGFFFRRKKIVPEVCRQLEGKKEKFTINIGNKLVITKSRGIVNFKKGTDYRES